MAETIRITSGEGVTVIALSRPDKLNAVNAAMHADLRPALDAAEADPAVRCVILTGAGRAFSSGQDLTEDLPRGADGKLDLGTALDRDYNPLIERLYGFPKVTIAALNGPAVGASANIALACDIVVGALGLPAGSVRPHRAGAGRRRDVAAAAHRRDEACAGADAHRRSGGRRGGRAHRPRL